MVRWLAASLMLVVVLGCSGDEVGSSFSFGDDPPRDTPSPNETPPSRVEGLWPAPPSDSSPPSAEGLMPAPPLTME